MIEDINYDYDLFEDILEKDSRYDARAYALLTDVVNRLGGDKGDKHFTGQDIVWSFRDRVLDLYGPLSYTVLAEWGVACTEDIGAMMFNLVEFKRVGKDPGDMEGSFLSVYDFKEEFKTPFDA